MLTDGFFSELLGETRESVHEVSVFDLICQRVLPYFFAVVIHDALASEANLCFFEVLIQILCRWLDLL